ncbi:Hemolysin, chromosomal [Shimia thalassica]|uniref:Hemolysin, chromosomal n=1 Tax=Shimia thalassica TaxID=1715693 RepID=A0A0N7MA79_9RHOB|nr:hypothetical protein [Shimia thalassica]CUK08346.1 Hemolysin, chromosomal [Shimia thalassica]
MAVGNNVAVPIGNEFQIDLAPYAIVVPRSGESDFSASGLSGGGFVVTWTSTGQEQDGWGMGVFGQRFSDNGDEIGAPFQVNTFTDYNQNESSVAALEDGGFVVTWTSQEQDGSRTGIFGQRFSADGRANGSEFQINSLVEGYQFDSSVSGLETGDFVVTWSSVPLEGFNGETYLQRYSASGIAIGEEFQIINSEERLHFSDGVTNLHDGGFLVTWVAPERDTDGGRFFGQLFDAGGAPTGTEFLIGPANVDYFLGEDGYHVAGLVGGGFVAAYSIYDEAYGRESVFVQLFDAFGGAIGSEISVVFPGPYLGNPSVTGLEDGGFVLTSRVYDGGGFVDVLGLRFDYQGVAIGESFQINSSPVYASGGPFPYHLVTSAISLDNGGFSVIWSPSDLLGQTFTGEVVEADFFRPTTETQNLAVEASLGWVNTPSGVGQQAIEGSTVYLGRKDGLERLLRIEGGTVIVDGALARVQNATVYSTQTRQDEVLFSGSFTLDLDTLTTTEFTYDHASSQYDFANVATHSFSSLTVNETEVSLGMGLSFNSGVWNFSTADSLLSLTIGESGIVPSFGTIGSTRLADVEPLELSFPSGDNTYEIEFSNISFSYDNASDSLYLGAAAEISVDLLGSTRRLEIDLAGDPGPTPFDPGTRFIRFSGLGDGNSGYEFDMVGTLTYSVGAETDSYGTTSLFAPSWGLSGLSLDLDTIQNSLGGSVTVGLPFLNGFEVTGGISFFWDPFALDAISFDVDGLNTPIFSTGLFLQGFRGGASGLANVIASDPLTYSGGATVSIGPRGTEAFVGEVDGEYSERSIDLELDGASTAAHFLPETVVHALQLGEETNNRLVNTMTRWFDVSISDVLDYEWMSLDGSLDFDWGSGTFEFDGQFDTFGGLVSRELEITANRNFDFSVRYTSSMSVPDAIWVIGGRQLTSVEVMFEFSNDDDFSNDFGAVWTEISLDAGIAEFSGYVGFQVMFDGTFNRLGGEEVEEINVANAQASGAASNLTTHTESEWFLDEGNVVLLSTRWDNASDNAHAILTGPDGTQYRESQFAELEFVQIVENLSDQTSRTLAIRVPETGRWTFDIESTDSLGDLSYDAMEILDPVDVQVVSASADDNLGTISVTLDVSGVSVGNEVSLYVSENADGSSPMAILVGQPISLDGQHSFNLDVTDIPPSELFVVATISGNGAVPATAVAEEAVVLTLGEDLSVSIIEGNSFDSDVQVFTVRVENMGTRSSAPSSLVLTLPENALLVGAIAGAIVQSDGSLLLDLGPLAAGEMFDVTLELNVPDSVLGEALQAEIEASAFDLDAFNNTAEFNLSTAEARSENMPEGATEAADVLRVAELGDIIDGQGGNDILLGNADPNRLAGGIGDDTLVGGDGNDTLIGGEGNDSLIGGDSEDDLRDLIYGGTGNDSIDGGYGNDELRGDAGNDTIAGGFGADTVIGGTGGDTLTGSAFADQIFGGDGDDFVNGGFGHDLLNGGAGADRFFHIGIFNHGSDWVQDYNAAEGDVLQFGIATATRSQFQINTAHTATAAGERSGDDNIEEAFVIYRPTGQIMWALVDGAGQSSINLQIGGDVFDLLA